MEELFLKIILSTLMISVLGLCIYGLWKLWLM